jgi:cell wall-associated NlpC family hydrolase
MGRNSEPKHLKESEKYSRRTLLITPALGIAIAALGGSDVKQKVSSPESFHSSVNYPDLEGPDVPRYNTAVSRGNARKTQAPQAARPTRQTQILRMRRSLVDTAKSFYGVPYDYGGSSRQAVDCSGLTMLVYRAVGLRLPHFADSQKGMFRRVTDPLPGDLLFYTSGSGYAYHVGLYLSRGMMIDAPHHGTVVAARRIWGRPVFGRHPALA